jgi:two-component system, LytTR family, response regulator
MVIIARSVLQPAPRRASIHLDPDVFLRIHRSAIVNLDEVARVVSTESGDSVVKLRDGTELRMSRSYRNKALQLLGRQPYL